MSRGLFITFEGGEGAGKSTLIERLHSELEREGYEVVVTREPGGTLLGDQIRSLLLTRDIETRIGDLAEMLLFLSARAQHIEELIKPGVTDGKVILCDRFNDSTVAYQGGGRQIGVEKTRRLCDLVTGTVKPDLTFFLDIDTKTGLERTTKTEKSTAPKGSVDRIEGEKTEFHERVRNAFLEIAGKDPNRVRRIDGKKSKDEVFEEAWKAVTKQLHSLKAKH